MRSRHSVVWGFAVLLSIISVFLLGRFVTGTYWRVAVEVSRMPVVLRPGAVVEFFFTSPQPWLSGIGIEHLQQQRPPGMRLELFELPDGDRVSAVDLTSRHGVLTGRFRPLTLPHHATLKARLTVDAHGSPVLLSSTPVTIAGVTQERPVVHTYHAMESHPGASFRAWCTARVQPLLPPGAVTVAVLLLAAAPVFAFVAVGALAALSRDERGA
ncbi:hypothetical protein JXA88_17230 [Candidatus Fermentibacteria bacterium]|nr:hypothetical protein [Candidatus Fermentibacteria bacterium]